MKFSSSNNNMNGLASSACNLVSKLFCYVCYSLKVQRLHCISWIWCHCKCTFTNLQFHSGCFLLVVVVAVVCYLFIRYSEFPNDFDHMMNVNWATILCVFLCVCMAQSLFKSPMFDIYTTSNDWFFAICVVCVLYRISDVVSLFRCTINCVDFTGFPLMWMTVMVQLCITIYRVLGGLLSYEGKNTPSHKSIYCYVHWHLFIFITGVDLSHCVDTMSLHFVCYCFFPQSAKPIDTLKTIIK